MHYRRSATETAGRDLFLYLHDALPSPLAMRAATPSKEFPPPNYNPLSPPTPPDPFTPPAPSLTGPPLSSLTSLSPSQSPTSPPSTHPPSSPVAIPPIPAPPPTSPPSPAGNYVPVPVPPPSTDEPVNPSPSLSPNNNSPAPSVNVSPLPPPPGKGPSPGSPVNVPPPINPSSGNVHPPGKAYPPPPPRPPGRGPTHGRIGSPQSGSPSPFSPGGVLPMPWVVGGVSAGAVVVLALLCILCFCCIKKKKKKTRGPEPAFYYVAPPPAAEAYGVSLQKWQQNRPPEAPYAATIPANPPPPPRWPSEPPQFPSSGHHSQPPSTYDRNSSSTSSASNSAYTDPLHPQPSPSLLRKCTFTYDELKLATDGFSNANLLGQGGFGYVHKGVLPSGKEVAIKQLKARSMQGEREFQAEVEIISTVHHKHLVSLVGYCIAGSHRMLVYEFVSNGTLEFHLHGIGRPVMDWASRQKIAIGSAKGLAYLHEDCHPKIIHRDIKAANILLDYDFEAKVADFGLAKFTPNDSTHISTRIMGTFGYLAPEYASSGKLTEKSDVFSFGVMLLELITGRRPFEKNQPCMEDCLVDWARPLLTRALEDGNFKAIVDPRLQNNYNNNGVARMVACASACVRHSSRRRPAMSQVVRALEGNVSLSDLNEGYTGGGSSTYEGSDYDSSVQYSESMSKLWRRAMDSHPYASTGQYSNPTSEYGLYASQTSSESGHKNSGGLSNAA